MVMVPFCVSGGISKSSSGMRTVALSDLTTWRLAAAASPAGSPSVKRTPRSPNWPVNCTSLFLTLQEVRQSPPTGRTVSIVTSRHACGNGRRGVPCT